jgi:putative acetyltransferase
VEIREVAADDVSAVEAVVASAFEEEPGGRVVRMVRALSATGAARCGLVAVDPAVDAAPVVGYVGLSRGWVDARRRLVDVLLLSPLAVRPDRQGSGIGTALVAASLAAADRSGAPAVFLEGDPAYYGSRGFAPATPLGFERPSTRIPEPAFQVALLATHEPWAVGRLVYPEAFWQTDTVGLRDPRLARVEAAGSGER